MYIFLPSESLTFSTPLSGKFGNIFNLKAIERSYKRRIGPVLKMRKGQVLSLSDFDNIRIQ